MLYFTDEVFCRLANQNRGHIHVMLECRIKLDKSFCTQKQSVPTAFKFYKKC